MNAFEFTVIGVAQPAGSKKGYARGGRVVIVDANAKAEPWKEVVASTARGQLLLRRAAAPFFPAHTPLSVTIIVRKVRPASHVGKTGLTSAGRAQPHPTSRPDVLKYARAVEDAMTEIVYADDAQIVHELLVKEWADRDEVFVRVEEVSEYHSIPAILDRFERGAD